MQCDDVSKLKLGTSKHAFSELKDSASVYLSDFLYGSLLRSLLTTYLLVVVLLLSLYVFLLFLLLLFVLLREFPTDLADRSRLPPRMVRSSSSTGTRNQSAPTCPPSASLQPISGCCSQQLLQQQVQPLPQRGHVQTPSPVGEEPLVRLPPPPHRSSHRRGSGERVASAREAGNGSTAGVEHRADGCSGSNEQQVELPRSFSSFSVSPSAGESLDFLRSSFYCDQQGSALGGVSTRCATVRPYIAQAESDSESEVHPPSPDRGWTGTH